MQQNRFAPRLISFLVTAISSFVSSRPNFFFSMISTIVMRKSPFVSDRKNKPISVARISAFMPTLGLYVSSYIIPMSCHPTIGHIVWHRGIHSEFLILNSELMKKIILLHPPPAGPRCDTRSARHRSPPAGPASSGSSGRYPDR